MTGSLQIKNEKYYIVLNTTERGRRKQKWINTGLLAKGNKRKAEKMLRDKLHEYELTPNTVQNDVLFAERNCAMLQSIRCRRTSTKKLQRDGATVRADYHPRRFASSRISSTKP